MKISISIIENIGIKICLYCLICAFIMFSCKNTKHNKIESNKKQVLFFAEIYYLNPNAHYPMDFNCGPIKGGGLPKGSERYYLKVTDADFMKNYQTLFENLKPADTGNVNFDVRIQALIHLKDGTDTLCMNGFNRTIVNGRLMQNSSEFSQLFQNQIIKDFTAKRK